MLAPGSTRLEQDPTHLYVPQGNVANVINVEFLKLYAYEDLQPHNRPGDEARQFGKSLVEAFLQDSSIRLVMREEDAAGGEHYSAVRGSIHSILAVKGLEERCGGRESTDPSSWLWDKGPKRDTQQQQR